MNKVSPSSSYSNSETNRTLSTSQYSTDTESHFINAEEFRTKYFNSKLRSIFFM